MSSTPSHSSRKPKRVLRSALRHRWSWVVGAIVIAVGAAVIVTQLPKASKRENDNRPNVLIVITDDQRTKGGFGVMPQTLRWFQRRGVIFPHAFVTTPLCCPSRASIATGKYVHNHHVYFRWTRAEAPELADSSVERYLDESGYKTAIFGKYLVGWPIKKDPPHFDEWSIIRVPHGVSYNGGVVNENGDVKERDEYHTDYVRERALSFLDDTADDSEPWFMYLTFKAPHAPYTPAPKYRFRQFPPPKLDPAMKERDLSDKPPFVRLKAIRPYSARIEKAETVRVEQLRTLLSVDDAMGDIFRELVRLGEDKNTLIIFLSDNGYTWGEHGLAGTKLVPYLPSVAVPLMVSWPGHMPAGTIDRRMAANVDIAPTVLEAAGLRPDSPLDGRPLDKPAERNRLLLEFWRSGWVPTWASTLTAKYQYIQYYDSGGSVFSREYYDLRSDPAELRNLLADKTTADDPNVAKLSRTLAADRNCVGSACP
jgi:arylsulfatase A-like enzyme